MKIYINADSYKEIAISAENDLIGLSEDYEMEIVDVCDEADIVFSIGGDGTFLKTSKMTDKPIIGINTGTLGYLTEVNPDDLAKALTDIKNSNYHVEERMMIEGEIIKSDGEAIDIPESLNEIYEITKNGPENDVTWSGLKED